MTRQSVDVRRFPWIRRLAVDYTSRFESLAPFFQGDPASKAAWQSAIARALAHPHPHGPVADILDAQQHERDAPAESRTSVRRLRDGTAVAIVTGQQAGLFGGPLFTLLKAVTAIRLAADVSAAHGVPAVPVFWIDAEDHDWNEVATTAVLDGTLRTREISMPRPEGAGARPVSQIALDGRIGDVLAALREALPPTEFTPGVLEPLQAAYAPGRGMVGAFARWLEAILGPLGLVVYDASAPAAKPLVRDLFAREVTEPGRTASLAAEAGSRLEAAGYHAQVTTTADVVALFHQDGERQAIRIADGEFLVGDGRIPRRTLVDRVTTDPSKFSPNVLLRPLVQDTLFPTACYVAGPSELAYLGQLRGVYERFGVPMPLIHPRASATLLDATAGRFLGRYDLPFESLQPQGEATLNRLLETLLPPTVERTLQEAQAAIQERMARVIESVPAIDPTLQGAAESTLGRMDRDLQTLHGKIIQAAKRRDETLRRQFTHAQAQAFPGGHPQERAIGFVYFLNQYGPALVDLLKAELPLEPGRHWILTL